MKLTTWLPGAALLAGWALAQASGLYKWVDEDGNVHYSDRPPEQAEEPASVETINVDDGYGVPRIPIAEPLPAPSKAASVVLSKFELRLASSEKANVTVGRLFYDVGCRKMVPLEWSDGFLEYRTQDLSPLLSRRFEAAGYPYSEPSLGLGQVELEGRIAAIRMDACIEGRNYGNRQSARNMKGSVWVRVGWRLVDRRGNVVFDEYSEGAYHGLERQRQLTDSFLRALEHAADNLLGNVEFGHRLASLGGARQALDLQLSSSENIVARLGPGDGDFTAKSEQLLASTVTVQLPQGHGSGVFIGASHVLTNAHVVGSERQVTLLKETGEQVRGNVVARNGRRDVALIKTASTEQPVSVSSRPLRRGEELFVIGTPLDVALSHTVTKGIFSAARRIDEQMFYQTDASINRGNSGGPVFDTRGELVGISVAGIFTREGAGLNVNYVIPIRSALSALNIDLEGSNDSR